MMKYKLITYALILFALLTACTTENDAVTTTDVPEFPTDDKWEEELMDGASATIKRFEPGDNVTRSSLYYDGQQLVFGWKSGDRLGLYPTAKDATTLEEDQKQGLLSQQEYPHPSLSIEKDLYRVDPSMSQQTYFYCKETTSQTTRISNGSADFWWDEIVRWSAYKLPKENPAPGETYENRFFSFKGQKQGALAEIGEYFDYEDATDAEVKNQHLNKYLWSESEACAHLGAYDVLISPETKWEEGVRINFQMRHVGAIIRLYLKVAEEDLVIKDVKLLCETPVFYEEGRFNLISHPYDSEAPNYGVDLGRTSAGCQIKPEPVGAPVKMLQLDFANTCVTKKSGSGWGPYVVAYMMTYPITYNPADHGELYAYVTAYRKGDSPSNEVHYVSAPLAAKTMESGNYYQWTSLTHPDDGFYPIEMTATELPWQDIVGAEIDVDILK